MDNLQEVRTTVDESHSPNPGFPKCEDRNVAQWTADDVKEWLVGIGFKESHIKKTRLGSFTGEGLMELKNWQATMPKIFLEFCCSRFGIQDSKLIVDFSAAIRKL